MKRHSSSLLALLASGTLLFSACAGPRIKEAKPTPRRALPRKVELFFRGEQPFARRGAEEWSLGDVTKDEMIFSPDGNRFAYLRDSTRAKEGAPAPRRVLVRNLAGDPVNEFSVYRGGAPESLVWLDNRRLGYLAPKDPAAKDGETRAFVTHDAESGEILTARSGSRFGWSPDRRHVAFLVGPSGRQVLVVDGQNVWPRTGVPTKFHGEFVWSQDGHGIAAVDVGKKEPRLIVIVEWRDSGGDLTWVVPQEALAPGLKVLWANETKVVIGESTFKPKFAAGWERVQ